MLGLAKSLAEGEARTMLNEDGSLRAFVGWDGDRLTAEVSEAVEGENGIVLVTLTGIYEKAGDSFQVAGTDARSESSDPHDVTGVACAFRELTRELSAVA